MNRVESVLSEIKTNLRVLKTWGNVLVPSLDGIPTTAQERLRHFVDIAQTELGMTMEEIEQAIA
jgi:hypothetical protein